MIVEPRIWSNITGRLPDGHALEEFLSIYCYQCQELVHDNIRNSCVQTWFETGKGPLCAHCFWYVAANNKRTGLSLLNPDYGLEVPDETP